MNLPYVPAVLLFGFFLPIVLAEPNYCGLDKADLDKTCISVRLPWQEEPIYFCQDKDKIKHKKLPCDVTMCPSTVTKNEGDLLIATPWDCCPLTSTPDFCKKIMCPAKAFNRTCVDIAPKEDALYDCCPHQFCEQGVKSRADCHKKLLEPSCQKPPKKKTKCVAFIDSLGCCPKYQCAEDAKPGLCPKEKEALKWNSNDNNGTVEAETDEEETVTESSENQSRSKRSMLPEADKFKKALRQYQLLSSRARTVNCVGDFNCPGKMKCCALHVTAYSDGKVLTKSQAPTQGFCLDPVEE